LGAAFPQCSFHHQKETDHGMRLILLLLGLMLGAGATAPETAHAQPAEIIILRHAEKIDKFQLCKAGIRRSEALTQQYLGKDATHSLFTPGMEPAAVIAITLHSLELAGPIATSWRLPVTAYTVLPTTDKNAFEVELNRATRLAAHRVLTDPDWTGKALIMIWEHNHIARARLEHEFTGEEVTLRELLNLDKLPNVPTDWRSQNYDYFWIVKYGHPGSDIPTSFEMVRQDFTGSFSNLPDNAWNAPEPMSDAEGCIKIGPNYTPH
jgi:hypothetical protein